MNASGRRLPFLLLLAGLIGCGPGVQATASSGAAEAETNAPARSSRPAPTPAPYPAATDPVRILRQQHGAIQVEHGPVSVDFANWRGGRAVAFSVGNERGYRLAYFPRGSARPVTVKGPDPDDFIDVAVKSIFAFRPPGKAPRLVVLYTASRDIPGMSDARANGGDLFLRSAEGAIVRDEAASTRLEGAVDAAEARRRLSR